MARFDRHLEAALRHIRRNAPRLRAVLEEHGWTFDWPEAGPTVAVRPPSPLFEHDFARARDAGYFMLPGEALAMPGTVRFSLFADPTTLDDALSVLEK